MLSDFITHQCLLHNYSTYSHAKKYTKVKVHTEKDICIITWAICTKISFYTISKHLKGRLGPRVSDVTFFNHGGRLGPRVSNVTFLDALASLGSMLASESVSH